MNRLFIEIIIAMLSVCVVLPLEVAAQKFAKNNGPNKQIKKVAGVEYEIISGLAQVISIKVIKSAEESDLNYDEHEVLFKFIPMHGEQLLEILKVKELEFKLNYHFATVAVGPAYIQKMNLKVGTKYAMDLFQTRSVNIKRFFYESKALENDLFQAYDNIVEGFCLALSFNAVDSLVIDVDVKKLSGVEQRVLLDAELKIGMKNGKFVSPQFTQAALDYLKEHKPLLEEYEAALAAVSRMLEDKHRQKELEEQLKKDRQAQMLVKIAAMKGASTPKVLQQTKIIRGCSYQVLPGLAEVTAIRITKNAAESAWNYNEHQLLFKFIPMQGHQLLDKLKGADLEFFLYHRGGKVPVGPKYLKQKNVRVGTRYAMTFFQKSNGDACSEQYTFESKGLDNDLFEANPPRAYFAALKTKMDSINLQNKASVDFDNKPIIKDTTSIDYDQMTYQEARHNVGKAIKERKKWRVICTQAIKVAKEKARNARKLQRKRKAEQKKNNNFETRDLNFDESIPPVDSNAISAVNISPAEILVPKAPSFINRTTAIRNARKKARLAKKSAGNKK